jgi:hypothetical protein
MVKGNDLMYPLVEPYEGGEDVALDSIKSVGMMELMRYEKDSPRRMAIACTITFFSWVLAILGLRRGSCHEYY